MPGRATAAPEERQRRPRGQELRRRILDAARNTFLAEGFEASMDTVAATAVTTKATVYKHFGNKEALFVAVIGEELDHALEEPVNLVASRLAQSSHVREDLIDACRAWVAGIAAPDMISLRNLVAGEVRRFPEVGEAWRERGPRRFHPVVADALRRLVASHRLSIADVDLAVLQLSGLVVSPNLVYGAYGDPVDAETRERLITAGVDMFVSHYQYRADV
ncbi:TetR/AcrR family transcriptional regulator C-terminal domain-containing protein [Streptomyces sp. NPDC026672]|uniref:TetR/AcrR family transcriptional regulator n=1 Tax=unclassified Streptomyces TaxID=2593676 RepID=UPI0033D0639E